jgi:hypothetical protein
MIKTVLPDSEIRRFRKWTETLSKENLKKCQNTVMKATELMVYESKRKAPVGKQIGTGSGHLHASIIPKYTKDKLGSVVTVEKNYGIFVEFATRPHIIKPKNGKVLAWQTRTTVGKSGKILKRSKLGPMAFASHVHHPGTRAQPFFYPVFDRVQRALIKDLNKMGFK